MHKKADQETLCTESESNTEEALQQIAVAFEEGLKRQASYGNQKPESKPETKTESISVCTITTGKICFGCGTQNFTPQHLSACEVAE